MTMYFYKSLENHGLLTKYETTKHEEDWDIQAIIWDIQATATETFEIKLFL